MMKRFNSKLFFEGLKQLIFRFPLTLLFIVLSTAWQIYLVDSYQFFEPVQLVLMTGIFTSAVSQLLYERFFKGKQKVRWVLYAAAVGIVLFHNVYLALEQNIIDGGWSFYSIPGIQTMIFYFILIMAFTWVPSIKSPLKFSHSFIAVFKAFFLSLFFSVVLFMGIMFILVLLELLFFSIDENWFSYTAILIFNFFAFVFFFYLIPNYEAREGNSDYEILERSVRPSKMLNQLISYILIPIMFVYTGIIVLYIAVNILGTFFYESVLEPLLLSYAIAGWILLILADPLENTLAKWFKKIFPFLLMIVLFFQMIATFLQIREVGITHGRYFILLFGAVSIICAALYIVKKEDLRYLPAASVIAGILAILPAVGAMSVSLDSQVSRVEETLIQNDMLEGSTLTQRDNVPVEDQRKIQMSINYLRSISALNQLSWLPETAYEDTNSYFGFERSYTDGDVNFPSEEGSVDPTWADVYRDVENSSIPISNYQIMLSAVVDSEGELPPYDLNLDGEDYQLQFSTNDEQLVLELSAEENDFSTEFDFSYILDEFDLNNQILNLPLEEVTFTEESSGYRVSLIINTLNLQEDQYFMDLIVLVGAEEQ